MAKDFLPNHSSPNSPSLLLVPRSYGALQSIPKKNHVRRIHTGPNAAPYRVIRKTLWRRFVGEGLLFSISNRVPGYLRRPVAPLHRRCRLHRRVNLHRPRRHLQAGDERRPQGLEATPPDISLRVHLLRRLLHRQLVRHHLPPSPHHLHRPHHRLRRHTPDLRLPDPIPRRRLLPDDDLAALERRLCSRRFLRIQSHGQELRLGEREIRDFRGYNPSPKPPSRNGAFYVWAFGGSCGSVGSCLQGRFGDFVLLVVFRVLFVEAGDGDGVVFRLQIIPS